MYFALHTYVISTILNHSTLFNLANGAKANLSIYTAGPLSYQT